jgi:hypothetical protein
LSEGSTNSEPSRRRKGHEKSNGYRISCDCRFVGYRGRIGSTYRATSDGDANYQYPIRACNINGVMYSVDANLMIWAVNAYGQSFVIGYIEFGPPTGYIAVRNDGVGFLAYCQ